MEAKRRVLKAIIILLLGTTVVLTIQLALIYLNLTVSSDLARRVLIQQLKAITQRDARIEGEVLITISLQPQLLVERIHVLNETGFGEKDLIMVSEARVQISLIPLFSGKLYLEELAADHAQINLIRNKDGSHNWSFDHIVKTQKPPIERKEIAAKDDQRSRISIDFFELTDITINYRDEVDDRALVKHLSRLTVDLKDNSKPHAVIAGFFQGYAYDFVFKADPLERLVLNEPWKTVGEGRIADKKARIDSVLRLVNQETMADVEMIVRDINLGLLLEHIGIITAGDGASENLTVKASFQGDDLSGVIGKSDFELQLDRGYLRWHARVNNEIRELTFEKAVLSASMNKPVQIHLDGKFIGDTIRLDLVTNPLHEFLDETNKLDVDLTAHVADGDISLKGVLDLPVTTRQFQLDVSFKGGDLAKLNRILASELPPFNDYSFGGRISSNEIGFVLKADDAIIGDTRFRGSMIIDTRATKPLWIINLDSKQLQIKDFEFADANLLSQDADDTQTSLQQRDGEAGQRPGHYLKQLVGDPAAHIDLTVKADRVLAGETVLGGFSLKMKLLDDALIMQGAELDVPGGRIEAAASFNIKNDFITGSLKLDADKFESGVVADYFIKGNRQGGLISARIDLQLGGNSFDRLFDHATGTLDVALWPRNVQTQIFDIWATNLLVILLPEIRKKEDRINCIVALLNLEDGIMTEDFIGLDTRKVWMHGNIHVDFKNEQLQLSLYPRSKKARLFAVQTPIRATGHFDDIGLTTNPVDLTVAYLSFITSPLHVPARRILGDKVPEDASEICEQFFDREYVKKVKETIKEIEQQEIDEWLDSD